MDLEQINARFFPPDRLIAADVAVVLGGNDPFRPAERAVRLYLDGQVRQLLFTGGFNPRLGANEADEMARFAQAAGVPDEAILIEPCASNTDENLQFSRTMLGTPSAVLLVAIHFHVARALLAARKHFPPSVDIGWTCYPSRYHRSADWASSPKGRTDVESETRKIALYYGAVPDQVS